MSPLRARYFVLPVLFAAAFTAAGIWYFTTQGHVPREFSSTATLPSSSSSPGTSSASNGAFLSLDPFDRSGSGGDDIIQVAAVEENAPNLPRKNVEEMLALQVRDRIPEARLSGEEIRKLAEEILVMRETLEILRRIPRTPDNTAEITVLKGRLDERNQRIQELTGMSTAEFLNRLTTEGIDNDETDKGELVLEYLDSPDR